MRRQTHFETDVVVLLLVLIPVALGAQPATKYGEWIAFALP